MLKKTLLTLLKFCATKILNRYRPEIIGVTGSNGKTSTKEAIFAVLAPHFSTRKTEGNYNTEIGVPLTIIGTKSGGRSIFLWLKVFLKALKLILVKNRAYPEILILEMGADKIGDIAYLTSFARPRIAIVTNVGISHLESFGTIENIAREKSILVSTALENGLVILNFDDDRVIKMRAKSQGRVITFGFGNGADVQALEVNIQNRLSEWKENIRELGGTSVKIQYQGNVVPLWLPNSLGKTHVYAALAAAAVGINKNLNLIKIIEALKCYESPPGRLKLLKGIKHTYLIDDTYNAAPASMRAALEVLRNIAIPEGAKKYAILGDMLELGPETEKAHKETGLKVAQSGTHELIAVGERTSHLIEGAREGGMSDKKLFHFGTVEEAGRFAQERIRQEDIILIKASRAMHFERIVKELMDEPLQADKLLVN